MSATSTIPTSAESRPLKKRSASPKGCWERSKFLPRNSQLSLISERLRARRRLPPSITTGASRKRHVLRLPRYSPLGLVRYSSFRSAIAERPTLNERSAGPKLATPKSAAAPKSTNS